VLAYDGAAPLMRGISRMHNMSLTFCQQSLRVIADRLAPILSPLGFTFSIEQLAASSGGDFASGFYSRDDIRIGLIYRASSGLGEVIYENSQASVSHTEMMEQLGHIDDNKLGYDKDRFASYAKVGGDPVEALANDLEKYVLKVFVRNKARFDQIVKDALEERMRKWGVGP
jgi:hypothetical protein